MEGIVMCYIYAGCVVGEKSTYVGVILIFPWKATIYLLGMRAVGRSMDRTRAL